MAGKDRKEVWFGSIAWSPCGAHHLYPIRRYGKPSILSTLVDMLMVIGMFIFAELFSKYLEAQLNRDDLLKELDPSNLPVKLDHV